MAAIVAWGFLNSGDELPSLEVQRLLALQLPESPTEGNAYTAMVGSSAPPGQDRGQFGRARLESQLRPLPPAGNPSGADTTSGAATLPESLLCRPEHRRCVPVNAAEASELAVALAGLRDVEQYFERMRALPEFEEIALPVSVLSPMPDFSGLVRSQDITLARVRIALAEQRYDDAVALLERDNAFARRALAGSKHVVGKRVSANVVARNALFVTQLWIVHGDDLVGHRARLAALLAPLPDSANAMAASFDIEVRTLAHDLTRGGRNSLYLLGSADTTTLQQSLATYVVPHLYRPIATANRIAELADTQRAVLKVPIEAFDDARIRAEVARTSFNRRSWDYIFNPIGSVLVVEAVPDFANYQAAMHDLQALLVLARARLAVAPVPTTADWSAALIQFRDPYTGLALVLDPDLGQPAIRARSANKLVGQMVLLTNGFLVADPPPLQAKDDKQVSAAPR